MRPPSLFGKFDTFQKPLKNSLQVGQGLLCGTAALERCDLSQLYVGHRHDAAVASAPSISFGARQRPFQSCDKSQHSKDALRQKAKKSEAARKFIA